MKSQVVGQWAAILLVLIVCAFAARMSRPVSAPPPSQGSTSTQYGSVKATSGPPPISVQMVTTPSGLQYQDIVIGAGAQPKTGQTIMTHYTGWLTSGTKFDSSIDRGQPFTFPLGKHVVILGWDEGLATMKVDGKRRVGGAPSWGVHHSSVNYPDRWGTGRHPQQESD